MKMKFFGYSNSSNDELLELREITACIDSKQAMLLSEFFAQCARRMEGDPEWEHEHFDRIESPALIVFNSLKMP